MCYSGIIKIIRTVRDSILRMINAKKKYKELRLAIIPPSLLFDVSVWMKFLFDVKKKIKKICVRRPLTPVSTKLNSFEICSS